jgi:hypothetical protein
MPAWAGVTVGTSITGSLLKASLFVVARTALQFRVNAAADRDFQAEALYLKTLRYL